MLFKCLDGKEEKFNIKPSDYPVRSIEECKSKLQWLCGQELLRRFPRFVILEEFSIPRSRLFLDFFLPQVKIALEAQGQQHFKYNSFFHQSIKHFNHCQKNDADKLAWCKLNGIELICVEREQDVGPTIANLLRKT